MCSVEYDKGSYRSVPVDAGLLAPLHLLVFQQTLSTLVGLQHPGRKWHDDLVAAIESNRTHSSRFWIQAQKYLQLLLSKWTMMRDHTRINNDISAETGGE